MDISAAFPVKVNKRGNAICLTVLIIRHGIMRGGKEPYQKEVFLRRLDGIGKILAIREPKASVKIIKGTDTQSIANRTAGNNGVKMVLFEISGKSW